jgi:predicted transcriptional regulator
MNDMATLTIRMPDDKHSRLKALARYRRVSVNKLIEELSTQALAEFDSEVRFRALAASGNIDKGLKLIDKLDTYFSKG